MPLDHSCDRCARFVRRTRHRTPRARAPPAHCYWKLGRGYQRPLLEARCRAGAALGMATVCPNGIDLRLHAIDLVLYAGVREYRSADLMSVPTSFEDLVAALCSINPVLPTVGDPFCRSNGLLDVSNCLQEVRSWRVVIFRSRPDPNQVEICGGRRARRSFKYPKRNFKCIGRCDRREARGPVAGSAVGQREGVKAQRTPCSSAYWTTDSRRLVRGPRLHWF